MALKPEDQTLSELEKALISKVSSWRMEAAVWADEPVRLNLFSRCASELEQIVRPLIDAKLAARSEGDVSRSVEPVAWLSRCIKGRGQGQVEFAEPNEKATNPEYWTDGFPVYAAPPPALPDEVVRLVKAASEVLYNACQGSVDLDDNRELDEALAPFADRLPTEEGA